jgi:MFS family permease
MRALGAGDRPMAEQRAAILAFRGGWGITDRRGFGALAAIGIVDSAVRTGFLTFLPFLLQAKGADVATIGLALGLAFAGGATGKFLCGVLAERAGILRTVIVTELVTALGILLLLPVPLVAALAILPLVGAALNGTSSVLYASVAEFVAAERRSRGFGLFYTLGIGSSATAPFVFGVLSDLAGVTTALVVVALLVTATLPLTLLLRAPLASATRQ